MLCAICPDSHLELLDDIVLAAGFPLRAPLRVPVKGSSKVPGWFRVQGSMYPYSACFGCNVLKWHYFIRPKYIRYEYMDLRSFTGLRLLLQDFLCVDLPLNPKPCCELFRAGFRVSTTGFRVAPLRFEGPESNDWYTKYLNGETLDALQLHAPL